MASVLVRSVVTLTHEVDKSKRFLLELFFCYNGSYHDYRLGLSCMVTGVYMKETILILANSYKHKLRCVAGKSLKTGRWVRLVADATGEAISRDQASFTNVHNGRYLCRPLQKIIMNIAQPVPLKHQPENVLCEPGWVQNYKIGVADIPQYIDQPESLWGPGKRISTAEIEFGDKIDQSLYLVEVDDLDLKLSADDKRRATFTYNDIEYDLPSTCPDFDKIISGEIAHNNYIVVSLGERHTDGYHYKIIATII